MKKKLFIIHLGVGNVGKTFIQQFLSQKKQLESRYGVEILYQAVFRSKEGLANPQGLSEHELTSFINQDKKGKNISVKKNLSTTSSQTILIDTTSSHETYVFLQEVLERGGYVVSSNKKPFSMEAKIFQSLLMYKSKIFFETTVGAGLPVFSTIQDLLETGDVITEIYGCLSGTLGFLSTSLEEGIPFSEAINQAKIQGYTEPDPRDDLSGIDVARKALILSRIMGISHELQEISITPLFSDAYKKGSVEFFLSNIKNLNSEFDYKIKEALKEKKTYKYIACISSSGIAVGFQKVDKESDLGNLKGPNNIISITSTRYKKYPLVIKGPGAGLEVTAAGIFADVLKIIRMVAN